MVENSLWVWMMAPAAGIFDDESNCTIVCPTHLLTSLLSISYTLIRIGKSCSCSIVTCFENSIEDDDDEDDDDDCDDESPLVNHVTGVWTMFPVLFGLKCSTSIRSPIPLWIRAKSPSLTKPGDSVAASFEGGSRQWIWSVLNSMSSTPPSPSLSSPWYPASLSESGTTLKEKVRVGLGVIWSKVWHRYSAESAELRLKEVKGWTKRVLTGNPATVFRQHAKWRLSCCQIVSFPTVPHTVERHSLPELLCVCRFVPCLPLDRCCSNRLKVNTYEWMCDREAGRIDDGTQRRACLFFPSQDLLSVFDVIDDVPPLFFILNLIIMTRTMTRMDRPTSIIVAGSTSCSRSVICEWYWNE